MKVEINNENINQFFEKNFFHYSKVDKIKPSLFSIDFVFSHIEHIIQTEPKLNTLRISNEFDFIAKKDIDTAHLYKDEHILEIYKPISKVSITYNNFLNEDSELLIRKILDKKLKFDIIYYPSLLLHFTLFHDTDTTTIQNLNESFQESYSEYLYEVNYIDKNLSEENFDYNERMSEYIYSFRLVNESEDDKLLSVYLSVSLDYIKFMPII